MQSVELDIENQIAPRGSSHYYSLMHVTHEQRTAICAVRAFAEQIGQIIFSCSDLSVAMQKFAWWQGEFQQMLSSTPSHPVTKSLLVIINQFQIPLALFQEYIDGIGHDLSQEFYETSDDLMHFYHHTAGAIERIIAYILGYSDQHTLIAVNYFGISKQIIRNIRDFRKIVIHNHCYISSCDLEQFHLSLSQLQQLTMTDEIRQLINLQAQNAKKYYNLALEQLPSIDRYKQCVALISSALSLQLLDQLLSPHTDVFKEYVRLTPLRKFIVAWKVHRKEKKLHNKS